MYEFSNVIIFNEWTGMEMLNDAVYLLKYICCFMSTERNCVVIFV